MWLDTVDKILEAEIETRLIQTLIQDSTKYIYNSVKKSMHCDLVGLVWFYGISTIVGYLMPNPLYTYILNIYDLVWLGFMT